jgi:non-canonical (house-cleaning) NTP pyrophosphatase
LRFGRWNAGIEIGVVYQRGYAAVTVVERVVGRSVGLEGELSCSHKTFDTRKSGTEIGRVSETLCGCGSCEKIAGLEDL